MGLETLSLPEGLGIRPSLPSDKAFIENLYRSTRDDLRLFDAELDFIETLIEQQLNAQTVGYGEQFPNAMYFIIEKQHHAIGRFTIDFGSNEVRLVDIAFIPEARGKGFGEGILNALKLAAMQCCVPLTLSVHAGNWRAKQLYLKLGFQTEESRPPFERMAWYPNVKEMEGAG